VLPTAHCFRLGFTELVDDIDPEVNWSNGDGASYTRLGQEVKAAVERIVRDLQPSAILLIGHSRGGLAARAYLQDLSTPPHVRFGLLTIGTPHQGSPFGRIPTWMRENLSPLKHYEFKRHAPEKLRFLGSPSTMNLATDHNSSREPVKTLISKAIWDLNTGAGNLSGSFVYGQIVSRGLALGQIQFGDDYLFDALGLFASLSNNVAALREFVFLNLPGSWTTDSDGIVPVESQRLHLLPGFSNDVWNLELRQIDHLNETSQTGSIGRMLDQLVGELAASSNTFSSSDSPAPELSEPEPDFAMEPSRFLFELLVPARDERDGRRRAVARAELHVRLGRGDEDSWAFLRLLLKGADARRAKEYLRVAVTANPARALPLLLEQAHISQLQDVRRAALTLIAVLGRGASESRALEIGLQEALGARDPADTEMLRALADSLSLIGTQSSVNALLAVVDRYGVSDEAAIVARSLLNTRNPDAVAPLLAALRRTPGSLSRASRIAGNTLAAMGRPEATIALLSWAESVSDPVETAAVVEWISQARDRDSWNILSKFTAQREFRDASLRMHLLDVAKRLVAGSTLTRESPPQPAAR
jgi:hypothetical protein